jgi:predicted lipoprotein with Yx(FWY)xxD motif
MKRNLLSSSLAAALSLAAVSAFAQQPAPAPSPAVPAPPMTAVSVGTATHAQHGVYLVDPDGRSLYMFEIDTRGEGNTLPESKCESACAVNWPPLLSDGEVTASGEAETDLLGTLTRTDGTTQVTYNGWPLYTYSGDAAPGEVNGHDIEDSGGEWYLVTPAGERVED